MTITIQDDRLAGLLFGENPSQRFIDVMSGTDNATSSEAVEFLEAITNTEVKQFVDSLRAQMISEIRRPAYDIVACCIPEDFPDSSAESKKNFDPEKIYKLPSDFVLKREVYDRVSKFLTRVHQEYDFEGATRFGTYLFRRLNL